MNPQANKESEDIDSLEIGLSEIERIMAEMQAMSAISR